jgi:amino acid permease
MTVIIKNIKIKTKKKLFMHSASFFVFCFEHHENIQEFFNKYLSRRSLQRETLLGYIT